MKTSYIISRFAQIFTDEEISRMSYRETRGIIEAVIVDVHGLKVVKARRLINNIINLIMGSFELFVIHGYHNGTAIRDMLREGIGNHKVVSWIGVAGNQGITCLTILAVCSDVK